MPSFTVAHMAEPPDRGSSPSSNRLAEALPPPGPQRWVARRKAAVVAAVRAGAITLTEACRRYHLSEEEYRGWEEAIRREGLRGLRVSRRHR